MEVNRWGGFGGLYTFSILAAHAGPGGLVICVDPLHVYHGLPSEPTGRAGVGGYTYRYLCEADEM